MRSKEINLFRELMENCVDLYKNPDKDYASIKSIILYHVFFYSLMESGVLHSDENWFYKVEDSIFEKGISTFKLQSPVFLGKIFSAEIYMEISQFINKHYHNIPIYYLGGIFYENLIRFKINKNTDRASIVNDFSWVKMHGVFYTPQEIAKEFVHGIFSKFQDNKILDINRLTVLDLACGCGIFSIQILQNLYRLVTSRDIEFSYDQNKYDNDHLHFMLNLKTATQIKFRLLINNLAAIDQDVEAIEITRYSLLLYVLSDEKHILSFDSFIRICQNLTKIRPENIFHFYINDRLEGGNAHDLVISNPPYISYYSRHSKTHDFSEDKLSMMRQRLLFDSSHKGRGRINSIMFFIDYAIRACKPEGYISLLVDMNIHEDLFLDIRRWVLSRLSLIESQININDFPGVKSGQSILYLRKSPAQDHAQVEFFDRKNNDRFLVPNNKLLEGYNFFIKNNSAWIERFRDFPKLGEYSRISSGINVGGSSENFIYREKLHESFYKLVSPSMMKYGYFLDMDFDQNFYVDFDKKKAEQINSIQVKIGKKNVIVLGRLERFLEPKIFVRQSASRIIASLVTTPMVCPYSIFVINQTSDFDLTGILGIMNSTLLTNYAQETGIIRQGAGKQPQIRKSGLYELPLPNPQDYQKHKDSLREAVQKMLLSSNRNSSKNFKSLKKIKLGIEEIVASLYHIKMSEYNLNINPER